VISQVLSVHDSRTSAFEECAMKPRFISGVINAEDMALIPGIDWVVASGMPSAMRKHGCLYIISLRQRAWQKIFPLTSEGALNGTTNPTARPPLLFSPHGVAIRPGADGRHTLYVAHHDERESVEIFVIDARGNEPKVTWQACLPMPPRTFANDLVAIPGGGFLVTNMFDPLDSDMHGKMGRGDITGNVLEWQEGKGWTDLSGSEMSGPNGIEVSHDGRHVYVGGWATKTLVRLSRGESKLRRDSVPTGHLTDNLTFGRDGWLLAAGVRAEPAAFMALYERIDRSECQFTVVKVHPETLETREIIRFGNSEFGAGTVALDVGNEIWVGSSRADRIACFPKDTEDSREC
jgi:SMP-30/Gluconolactonase/LRE-like region